MFGKKLKTSKLRKNYGQEIENEQIIYRRSSYDNDIVSCNGGRLLYRVIGIGAQ